jgi:predicted DNA-binding protein (MmcQ/YjbR family)
MTKKSDAQALKWMRDVCLALPGTSEGTHFGEIVFKANGRLFASCGDKRGPRVIVFRIDAKRTAELLERDPRFRRYPFEKSALSIAAGDIDDWEQLRGFVEESYRTEAHPARKVKPAKPTRARTRRRPT